jgi:sugar porter (SP) family MFS transporter
MTIGAVFISDTPNSLVERGKTDEARQSLIRIRGKDADVEPELAEIIKASEIAREATQEPFLTMFKRMYRPHIVIAILLPCFQQLTGINIIAFYAPVLFKSVGFGDNSSYLASIILAGANFCAIMVSTGFVDRYGRRFLLIAGGTVMFFCLVAVSSVLGVAAGNSSAKTLPTSDGIAVLVLMCMYSAGFGWSWGPLSWLIPSEIFPIRIRPTGQSISIAVGSFMTFLLTQTFLTMLCHLTYGTFLFYACWMFVMTGFAIFFIPETKGISIDSMYIVWGRHWFWHRFVQVEEKSVSKV